MESSTLIEGTCHCGNIRFNLQWPGSAEQIAVRECSCSFCQKHGGVWTSNPDATLSVLIGDASNLSKYRFGTATADFYVCATCGTVPFVISDIENHLYAVVNVNTFVGVDKSAWSQSVTNFDGEDTDNRLSRRKRNWIPNVTITTE